MIDHNHFICHFIFGGHLLNIPKKTISPFHTEGEIIHQINILHESGS